MTPYRTNGSVFLSDKHRVSKREEYYLEFSDQKPNTDPTRIFDHIQIIPTFVCIQQLIQSLKRGLLDQWKMAS